MLCTTKDTTFFDVCFDDVADANSDSAASRSCAATVPPAPPDPSTS